jgi:hypothetical protein
VVTAADGIHVLDLATGSAVATFSVPQAKGLLRNPILVGTQLYVLDDSGLLSFKTNF